jgi:hypothetical protein
MNRRRLLLRLARGSVNIFAFSDFTDLVQGFGFELDHVIGSHHIYRHRTVPQRLNLQPARGEAKPYQIRQFLRLVEHYQLQLEDDE